MAYSIESFHQVARDYTLGFDEMFDQLFSIMENRVSLPNFPPYNIVKISDDLYQIQIALAGMCEDDITVEVIEQKLIVKKKSEKTAISTNVLKEKTIHRGIATRNFEKMWTLAEDLIVQGASFVNGMLDIDIARIVPEHKKPRTIEVSSSRKEDQDQS